MKKVREEVERTNVAKHNKIMVWSERIDQEAKRIAETLQIQKVQKCEVRGLYVLKLFYLADNKKINLHNGMQMEKMYLLVDTKIPM